MSEQLRVLVTVPFCEQHMERLREAAGPHAVLTQVNVPLDGEEMRELLKGADAVIGEPAPGLLAEGTPVRWVQMTWAGTDLYTRGRVAFPPNTQLTNVAGIAFGHIISQFVVGQVIAIAQNFPAYVRLQEREEWMGAGPVASLEDARVLILGAGDLGGLTAKRLSGFDCHCTGVCRNVEAPRPYFERLVTLDDAEDELPVSDVVINCLPNTDETKGWLDERRLRLMRRDAILANVGRGNFVDCDALARVLAEGRLRGAALDVTEPEPLPKGHPLWQEPRCFITPHQAGGSFGKSAGTEERICEVACANLRHFVSGEPLEHRVI
ncbi:MAG: D-2-hydroxyacid dehydrogenase [Atopobiaceae bacterium]|nr:D-2-hydroxyacid dehydrogenase [Atopobiaceae bacterium]